MNDAGRDAGRWPCANMEEYIRVLTEDDAIEAVGNGGRGGEGILDVIRLTEAQRKE